MSSPEPQVETQERIGYELSDEVWGGQGTAVVTDRSGQELLIVPVNFVRQGLVDNFAYILQCVHRSFVVNGGHICNEQGVALGPLDAVTPGRFVYWNADNVRCTPRIGPRFKYKARAPNAGDETSTMSNSKRSSANQSDFFLRIVARDFSCLISDTSFDYATACHILPISRPEYYAEALGRMPPSLYRPHLGLLLRDDLHHAFDRGHIALYPLMNAEDDLVVHVFFATDAEFLSYHGKVIRPRERFRGLPNTYPNTQLLLFHYQQCVIRCLRGWSSF